MFNDHLSPEEAQKIIEERRKEAETYSLQKQLGFSDSRPTRWIFLLIVIVMAAAAGLLL